MNKAILYKMLRWATVLLAVIFLVNLYSDGKEGVTDASFAELNEAVCAQVDTSLMQLAEPERLERFYGVRAEEFANCTLYLPIDSMVYVEELVLIELKDASQKEALLAAIDARLNTQKNTFENYNLYGQYEKLCDHAVIEVRGNFVLFAINCDAAVKAFLAAV